MSGARGRRCGRCTDHPTIRARPWYRESEIHGADQLQTFGLYAYL